MKHSLLWLLRWLWLLLLLLFRILLNIFIGIEVKITSVSAFKIFLLSFRAPSCIYLFKEFCGWHYMQMSCVRNTFTLLQVIIHKSTKENQWKMFSFFTKRLINKVQGLVTTRVSKNAETLGCWRFLFFQTHSWSWCYFRDGVIIPNPNIRLFSVHLLKLCPRFRVSKYGTNHPGLFGVCRLILMVNKKHSLRLWLCDSVPHRAHVKYRTEKRNDSVFHSVFLIWALFPVLGLADFIHNFIFFLIKGAKQNTCYGWFMSQFRVKSLS